MRPGHRFSAPSAGCTFVFGEDATDIVSARIEAECNEFGVGAHSSSAASETFASPALFASLSTPVGEDGRCGIGLVSLTEKIDAMSAGGRLAFHIN